MGIEIIVSSFWCHCAAYVLEFIHTHTHTLADKAAKCALLRNNKMLVIVGYYGKHTHTRSRTHIKHTHTQRRAERQTAALASTSALATALVCTFFSHALFSPLTFYTFTFECSALAINLNINCTWAQQKKQLTGKQTRTQAYTRTVPTAFTQINVHK